MLLERKYLTNVFELVFGCAFSRGDQEKRIYRIDIDEDIIRWSSCGSWIGGVVHNDVSSSEIMMQRLS